MQYVPACRTQGWERLGVPHPAPPPLFLTHRKQKCEMTVVTKLVTKYQWHHKPHEGGDVD